MGCTNYKTFAQEAVVTNGKRFFHINSCKNYNIKSIDTDGIEKHKSLFEDVNLSEYITM